ncbi:unnamed protein product [Sphagnum tenellum]
MRLPNEKTSHTFYTEPDYKLYTSHQNISKFFSLKAFTKVWGDVNFPYLDVFAISEQEDEFGTYILMESRPELIMPDINHLFPVRRTKFMGSEVSIPRNVSAVLEASYSKDYMTICRTAFFNHKMDDYFEFETDLEIRCAKLMHLFDEQFVQ